MSTYLAKRVRDLGLKKIDAKKPLIVSVNPLDIKKAQVKNPECCALARACKRQHDGVVAAYFFRTSAWLEYADRVVHYALPPSVQKEIVAFDRNKSMEPGNYQLSAPARCKRLDYDKARNGGKDHNPHRKRGKKDGASGRKASLVHSTTNVRGLFVPAGD